MSELAPILALEPPIPFHPMWLLVGILVGVFSIPLVAIVANAWTRIHKLRLDHALKR